MTLDFALSFLLMPATVLVLGWAVMYFNGRSVDAARARRKAAEAQAKAEPGE